MDFYVTEHKHSANAGDFCVALEDSILQKDVRATAGSKMLKDFIAPFDATVVTRLTEAGMTITGKTRMDEFGIGRVSGEQPDTLSGAVEAVSGGYVRAALCNDHSGTVRRQASENGVCYIHPTYGTVSRYGLIPAISSMDQIGVVCKELSDGFEVLSAIAGHDINDGAMLPQKKYSYHPLSDKIRVGVPSNVMKLTDDEDKAAALDFAGQLESVETQLEYFDAYAQVMYILGCAEISNNISRYDGVKFGYRAENYKGLEQLYQDSRTQGLGSRAKLTAIMGAMVLSSRQYTMYYEKAMKLRRLIKQSLRFDCCDVIVLPSWPKADPYRQSALYALATLAGLPSASIPYRGGAVQLIAGANNENALFSAWEAAKL